MLIGAHAGGWRQRDRAGSGADAGSPRPCPTGRLRHDDNGAMNTLPRAVQLLLNLAHALDHLFLLIFATAVAAIARDFGLCALGGPDALRRRRLPDVRLGSLPAGRLGDLWGRRRMMLCSSSAWARRRCWSR
jgi:hypothetical protein